MDGTPHEVRLRLLANGYEPLPLQGKAPNFKGWNDVEITADFLKKFRRAHKLTNTGLRCGGKSRLIGIDIDCDIPEIVDDIIAALKRCNIDTHFVRIGRAPRAMLLFRLSSGQPMIAKLRSGSWAPIHPPATYAVEVLGECHQLAAYGIHPDTEQPYEWPDHQPTEWPITKLPVLMTDQLRAITRIADDIFEHHGLQQSQKRSADNEGLLSDAYDLTDDMLFSCINVETEEQFNASVAELEELIGQANGNIELRCCCAPFRKGADNIRTGQIRLTDNGLLITDYATFVRHRKPIPDLAAQLAESMTAAGIIKPDDEAPKHESVAAALRWHFEKNNNTPIMQTSVMNAAYLPDCRRTPAGRPAGEQMATIENIEFILERCDVKAKYDMMRKRFEINFPPDIDSLIHTHDPDNRTNLLASYLQDFSNVTFGIGVSNFKKQLELLATKNPFHPIEDWILTTAWDGTDRIAHLAKTIPTDDILWDVYLRKWLIQAIEAWAGWRKRHEQKAQVLVIVGEQGKRKTTWISRLAPPIPLACVTGESVHMDYQSAARDTMARVLQHGMVELGELETTFKRSDSGALKNFLSRPIDRFRRAYGEGELTWPRTTVFIASVNIADVLDDPTGARRFWPIRLKHGAQCDTDHKIDLQQLWRQAYELWAAGQPWWLVGDEVKQHNTDVFENFMRPTEARDVLESRYGALVQQRRSTRLSNYTGLTVVEIANANGLPHDRATLGEISAWMSRNFGEKHKFKGKKNCYLIPIKAGGNVVTFNRAERGSTDGDVSDGDQPQSHTRT